MALIKRIFDYIKLKRCPIDFWRAKGAKIGANCEIYSSVSFGSEPYLVELGNHVRVNSGVQFITHDGGVWVLRGWVHGGETFDLFGVISVGNNVHIGTNTIIMPNVKIGSNVIIGCGAIVTHDIPDNSVAVGIPARVIESIDEYYQKNKARIDNTKLMSSEKKKEYLMEKYK